MKQPQRPKTNGFTLIEVLLAMVISMIILSGIGFLYYSIAMAWISHKEGDVQLQHNHSIFAYLEDELSVKPTLPSIGNELNVRLQWMRLPGAGNYDPVYLSWVTESAPAFIRSGSWFDEMGIRFFLKFDSRKGLSLIWHPEDPKIDRIDMPQYDVEDYLFEFPLSSKVSGFAFAYYDREDDEWEEVEHTRNFDPQDRGLPNAIILSIEERDEVVFRTLYLPQQELSDD